MRFIDRILRPIDEIGRLTVPKYVRDLLKVNKGDLFETTVDVDDRSVTFKYKKKGAKQT